MKKELNEMWDECVKIIRENISQEQFNTIFASIKPTTMVEIAGLEIPEWELSDKSLNFKSLNLESLNL